MLRYSRRGSSSGGANRHVSSQAGASSVEYAIMVTLVAAVVIVTVAFMGRQVGSDFSCTASAVSAKPDTDVVC